MGRPPNSAHGIRHVFCNRAVRNLLLRRWQRLRAGAGLACLLSRRKRTQRAKQQHSEQLLHLRSSWDVWTVASGEMPARSRGWAKAAPRLLCRRNLQIRYAELVTRTELAQPRIAPAIAVR